MPTTLTITATEQSTFVLTPTFTDEDGSAVIPNSDVTWTLFDSSGAVVNSREDVSIAAAASLDIVLTGDDLVIDDSQDRTRWLLLECTYDSSLGNGLSFKDQVTFEISDLLGLA